ncbi:hypothetical protein C7999DRAFT_35211 [Corynascus novoguineensis]|uniref:Uncharacterized protein n=1 Tax=Corynascus novoguineensis TaxID=1126955 RepID=A0AAN7CNQ7_9PEZI|nr:hypothetical protein C7999DRAFT_35211 [Corynascus novoguineensis]
MCYFQRIWWGCGCYFGVILTRRCEHRGTLCCQRRHLLDRWGLTTLCPRHRDPPLRLTDSSDNNDNDDNSNSCRRHHRRHRDGGGVGRRRSGSRGGNGGGGGLGGDDAGDGEVNSSGSGYSSSE